MTRSGLALNRVPKTHLCIFYLVAITGIARFRDLTWVIQLNNVFLLRFVQQMETGMDVQCSRCSCVDKYPGISETLLKTRVRFLYYSYSSSTLILMELHQLPAAENLTHVLICYPMSLLKQPTCFWNSLLILEIIALPEMLFQQQSSSFFLLLRYRPTSSSPSNFFLILFLGDLYTTLLENSPCLSNIRCAFLNILFSEAPVKANTQEQ